MWKMKTMADCRAQVSSWVVFTFVCFITPSRKQTMFVNLPVADPSPLIQNLLKKKKSVLIETQS